MKYFNTLKNALNISLFNNADEESLSNEIFPKVASQFLYGGFFLLNGREKLYLREIEFYFLKADGSIKEDKMYRRECPDDDWLDMGTLFAHNSGVDITFEDSSRHLFRASVLIRAFDLFDIENNPILLDEGRSLKIYDSLLSRNNIMLRNVSIYIYLGCIFLLKR